MSKMLKVLNGLKLQISTNKNQIEKERLEYLMALVSIYLLVKLGPDQAVESVLDECDLVYDQIENIILTVLGGNNDST